MTTFHPSSKYYGGSHIQPPEGDIAAVSLEFTVMSEATPPPSGTTRITPLMVAEALNDLLVANGWPEATFYGTPVDEPLN